MGDPAHRRRTYVIDPEFQYRLMGRIAIQGVMITVASLLLLASVYHVYGGISVEVLQPDPFHSGGEIRTVSREQSLFSFLWPVMLACVAATLLVTLVFGVLLSHRMAGPVFRMRRALGQLMEGDLAFELRLRKNDAFKPMAETINELRERWTGRIEELQSICRELDVSEDDQERAKCLERLREIVATFKTK